MKTIILGPPGTGKTTTLLNLVDEFIQQGIRPKQIGYFSFTKKAATEAATRAAEKFSLDVENDLVLLYDASVTAVKKVKASQVAPPVEVHPFLIMGG